MNEYAAATGVGVHRSSGWFRGGRPVGSPGCLGPATVNEEKGDIVGIGAAILLIAIGAILAFAVHVHLAGIDITVVGWILMIVGVIGLVLTLTIWAPWRRRRVAEPVVEERRMYRDEPPPP